MTTYFLLTFVLISSILFACFMSSSSSFVSKNDQHLSKIYKNEGHLRILPGNNAFSSRYQRSPSYYPRANRNTWFRVSTYQHFKPSGSEETPNGDPLMRWGRKI